MALRILVVDDHELTRAGIRALLAPKKDWEICGEAANGDEAIAKFQQLRPDVIVLDVSMAGRNGFEVAETMRRSASGVRIVFFSMHSVDSTAKQVGADEFVSKSSPSQELVAAIERVAKKIDADSTRGLKNEKEKE